MKRSDQFFIGVFSILFLLFSTCSSGDNLSKKRKQMINRLKWQGVNNQEVLNEMAKVPRHKFVLKEYENKAYDDWEVPISHDDTLNRPIENAIILNALNIQPTDVILEVGTGSGYQAALMSKLAKNVYSIEIVPEVAIIAKKRLKELGFNNISIKTGDGFFGWKEKGPFDSIYLSCSPPGEIPKRLVDQLKEGGLILAPIGGQNKFQSLILYQNSKGKLQVIKRLSSAQFSPMKGEVEKQ